MKRALKLTMLGVTLAALSACGGRQTLQPPPGSGPVPVAVGAKQPATADQLMGSTTQARPDRSAEPVWRSEVRRDDYFDLPPEK